MPGRPAISANAMSTSAITSNKASCWRSSRCPSSIDQISQNEATLNQLKAALEQAQANLKLAQVTWDRDRPLVNEGWVTQQQGTIDVQTLKAQEAAVGVAQANVTAQESQLRVLRQNRDYASVVAPFDGVITQRNVDVGSLVQGNANTGTFMFEIMQKDVIRVLVYVPQDAAFGVAPGVDAIVRVPEIPDREFPGKVTRIADALQSGTRTLLTEIDIPNPDGALPPGIYCTVELKIPRKTPSFIVPAEAIIFNRNGLQVAVVKDGKARSASSGDARLRHVGRSGRRSQARRPGDPQSAGHSRRWQQGTDTPRRHGVGQMSWYCRTKRLPPNPRQSCRCRQDSCVATLWAASIRELVSGAK